MAARFVQFARLRVRIRRQPFEFGHQRAPALYQDRNQVGQGV
jgi:hypothetical protein